MDKKKIKRIVLAIFGSLAALTVGILSAYMLWERAPEVKSRPETLIEKVDKTPKTVKKTEESDGGKAFDTQRKDGVYTILLVGNDDGNGNTDTIMVAKLDTVRHSLNVVSIPRDTLINVDWPVRKLNAVYWGAVNNGGSGIDALLNHVKKLVGFDIDCYAVLDLEAFVEVVDVMGGVYFDVPTPICYEDYWQGLYLDIDAGFQLLDGYQSMCLCRYRSGYITGDIGRIDMQHKFLKAAAQQYIELGKIPNATEAIGILADSMDTNLSAANMAFFVRQVLMCGSEDINFYTAPNTPAFAQEYSYAFLNLYEWLDMVNTYLNPFNTPISEGNLDLVYILNGEVHCTAVLKGSGYFDLGRNQGRIEAQEETQDQTSTPQEPTEEAPPEEEPPENAAEPENDWLTPYDPPEPEQTMPPFLDFPVKETEPPGGEDWLTIGE